MLSASVSEIHLFHRCSRLLAYHRSGRKNAWKVGLAGTDQMPGTFFHDRIAAPFYKTIASGTNNKVVRKLVYTLDRSTDENRAEYLLAFLESCFFIPVVTKYGKRFQARKIITLGRGLELWNSCLTRFLNQFDPVTEQKGWKTLLNKCFHDPEVVISVRCKLDEKTMIRVSGRYDALMLNPDKGEAIIVEFKGRKAGAPDEDFLQVALYGWLLNKRQVFLQMLV
ncbi:MAG: PD-(D/E)XK nuclease family protein [Desulfobacterales bacterium]